MFFTAQLSYDVKPLPETLIYLNLLACLEPPSLR